MANNTSHTPLQPLDIISTETLHELTSGFLSLLEPEMIRVQQSLEELTNNQNEMLLSIQHKRAQFEETSKNSDISVVLQQVPVYRQKVANTVKNMQNITKKVKRLQARANKLKEARRVHDNQKKRDLERRIREEQLLEAKPAGK